LGAVLSVVLSVGVVLVVGWLVLGLAERPG
jgi:hypothetical protein